MRVSAAMSPALAASISPPDYSYLLSYVVFPGSGACYLNSIADKRHSHRLIFVSCRKGSAVNAKDQ
jgi:hypothetical protein